MRCGAVGVDRSERVEMFGRLIAMTLDQRHHGGGVTVVAEEQFEQQHGAALG